MTEQEIIDYLKQNRKEGEAFDLMPEEVKQWCWTHQIEQNVIYDDTEHIMLLQHLRKEKFKMTEQEIIDYLKQNREKGVTFDFMPNEVKHWCNVHRNKKIFYIYYSCGWRGEESCIDCRGDGVYCLSKDYAQFKTDWQEFNIDEDGYFEFEDKKYYYREDARFETENRDKFKGFGGWLFKDMTWCTNPHVITHFLSEDDSISDFVSKDETCEPALPTKIRFWRYRE